METLGSPSSSTSSTIGIPVALQNPEFIFILLKAKDKSPVEKSWTSSEFQYSFSNPKLIHHLQSGGNYGIVMGKGRLCCFDADDVKSLDTLGLILPFNDTFTVSTGKGRHYYFLSDLTGKRIIHDPEDRKHQLGDIRGGENLYYIVGPGSIHPSGKMYMVIRDVPLQEIPTETVKSLLDRVSSPPSPATPRVENFSRMRSISNELNLHCEEFLLPDNATNRGDELVGAHPIHGSETETNLHVNTQTNQWKCFRCDSGGGPLEALAVAEGIIECFEAGPGCLKEHWSELLSALKKRGYKLPDAFRGGNGAGRLEKKKDPLGGSVDLSCVAEMIQDRMHVIAVGNSVYFYEDGIYHYNIGQIEQEIQKVLKEMGYSKKIIDAKREIKSYLTHERWYKESPFNKWDGYIPTQDCVLHITEDGIEVLPHDPKYLFTYKLRAKYDPGVDTHPLMDVFRSWVTEEDFKYLIQLPALAIVQSWGHCFKQAYLFEGPRNAAKTTYFNLLDPFIGEENRSSIPLHTLVTNRFAAVGLIGKLMNVVDELPSVDLKNLDMFKSIIGGAAIHVERKGEDGYSARPTAVHCFNCNRPPVCKISDDDAWWGRWVYVQFINTFPVNPTWKREFLTEDTASALLNLVLPKVQEIYRTGLIDRMEPEDVKQIWMESSEFLVKFMSEECDRDPNGHIPRDEFYDRFVMCCGAQKKTALTRTACTQMLGRLGVIDDRPTINGERVYAYKGIVWKAHHKGEGNTQQHDHTTSTVVVLPHLSDFSKPSKEILKKETYQDQDWDELHIELSKSQTSQERVSSQFPNPVPTTGMNLIDFLERYNLPIDTDISQHIRFTKTDQFCICKGCGVPAIWHGPSPIRPTPLCDHHYHELTAGGGCPLIPPGVDE